MLHVDPMEMHSWKEKLSHVISLSLQDSTLLFLGVLITIYRDFIGSGVAMAIAQDWHPQAAPGLGARDLHLRPPRGA